MSAFSKLPPRPSPRAQRASTSCKYANVRAPAISVCVILGIDLAVEVLRTDRARKIRDEAHPETVGWKRREHSIAGVQPNRLVELDHFARVRLHLEPGVGDSFDELGGAAVERRNLRSVDQDLGVTHAHREECREQVLGG